MTTTISTATAVEGLPQLDEVGRGTLLLDVMRSEWTKICTVRSTFWTLVAAVVAMVGIAVVASEVVVHQWATLKPEDKVGFSSIELALAGAFFAQLAVGVLGVLVITTEYGTGMIRATFAAVPQRRLVLGAKALVLFGVTLAVGVASSFVAFFTAEFILGTYAEEDLTASLSDPGALRAVLGAGVFLALMGLLGMAVGAVLRRSAGAITALFGLVFFIPVLMELLPHSIKDSVNKFLPSNAGTAIYRQVPGPDVLSPGMGMLVLGAYALGALAVAAVIVQRRDA